MDEHCPCFDSKGTLNKKQLAAFWGEVRGRGAKGCLAKRGNPFAYE